MATLLDYLKVLLTWPVIGGGLIAVFLLLFRLEIKSLINRIGRIKFPGGEFSTSQQEKIEQVEQTQPGPVTSPEPNPPKLEGMHLTAEDLEIIQAYFNSERATARVWEYRYLNLFLAQTTQVVLDWLVTLQPPTTTIGAFEATWMHVIQDAQERSAVLHALQMHVLINVAGQTMSLTEKGREYAHWPERRIMIQRSRGAA
jgi:hypothetical protein